MSDKATANGTPATDKPGFMARLRRHCVRLWWAYLIAFIVVALVVILPVIFVGYPNMAQDAINKSTLEIMLMELTEPRPDGAHLKVSQKIGSDSPFNPWMDAFTADLTLEGSDEVFAQLNVPRFQADDGLIMEFEQDMNLANPGAFTEFSKAIMHNESIQFNVWGETKLKQGALQKVDVTYDQTVTMKGLNGLKGFNLTEFHLIIPPEESGVNMRGTVLIPNPSVLRLTMGNLTLNLAVDNEPVGTSTLSDVVIVPGDNIVEMASIVNQTHIIRLITAPGSPYSDGIVPIQITGNSSTYNGEQIPYFTEALASNVLTIELNILSALGGSS